MSCCSLQNPYRTGTPPIIIKFNTQASQNPETCYGDYLSISNLESIACVPGTCSHNTPCPSSTKSRFRHVADPSAELNPGREPRANIPPSATQRQSNGFEDRGAGSSRSPSQYSQRKRVRFSEPSETEGRVASDIGRSESPTTWRNQVESSSTKQQPQSDDARPIFDEFLSISGQEKANRAPDSFHLPAHSNAQSPLYLTNRALDSDSESLTDYSLEEHKILIFHSVFRSSDKCVKKTHAFDTRRGLERFIDHFFNRILMNLDIDTEPEIVPQLRKDKFGWQRFFYEVDFPVASVWDLDLGVIVPHDYICGPVKESFTASLGKRRETDGASTRPKEYECWESWVEAVTLEG
ncbi:hypothetical protein TWF506_003188 [Arthrobotrys conoides]|uniref:Uncharacterized protein n=1 Tax=Arthrobotrys conoides TaxID=74498 RepID=A0AAN8NMY1_9PEZI